MTQWWLHLIAPGSYGAEFPLLPGGVTFHWARPGFLWAGLLLALPLMGWIYARHRRNLPHVSRWARVVMTFCRTSLFVLLMLVLAGPFVRLDSVVTHKPVIAVIRDVSQSMDMSAGPFTTAELAGPASLLSENKNDSADATANTSGDKRQTNALTRWQVSQLVLDKPLRAVREASAARFDWRLYEAGREVQPAPFAPPEVATQSTAATQEKLSSETALGAAIERVFADAAGRRLAAIVLLTDGRNTIGPAPLAVMNPPEVKASAQAALPAPLAQASPQVLPVAIGTRQPQADIAVADVLAPGDVAMGDAVAVLATVQSSGYDGTQVTVRLKEDGKEVDAATLVLAAGRQQQVTLTYEPSAVGPHMLEAAVDVQGDEPLKANNARSLPVQVGADRLRVLYVEGYPRWDYCFLEHELRRDRGLEVDSVMESSLRAAGVEAANLAAAAHLPATAEQFAAYDLVMLGDISPAMLPTATRDALAQAVREHGVGLLVQAGFQHMPHEFVTQPGDALAPLLPVTIARRTPLPEHSYTRGGELAPAFKPFRMQVTAAGSMQPAFHLFASASRNRELWSQMPVFYWCASASEPRAGAEVLARVETAEGEYPLIATQYAGRGRVMFVGTDSTYRWRRNIGSALFSRFWGQAIRYAARTKGQAGDASYLTVYPQRIEPDEQAAVELYAVDASGTPMTAPTLEVVVEKDVEEDSLTVAAPARRVTLRRAGDSGFYRGGFTPGEVGRYKVSYAPGSNATPGNASAPRSASSEISGWGGGVSAMVQVAGSQRELLHASMDYALLDELAQTTGGRVLAANELSQIESLIEATPTQVRRVVEAEAWDNWLTLVVLVGLYCLDVGVRRVLGLT